MRLYSYFRSSAAYRVRIALNLKGLPYETIPVHLLNHGGEQHSVEYRRLNPEGLIPLLLDDGQRISQSLAIIEYLDETHPENPVMPADALGRARVRSLALAIACDIHPLNNLRVLNYLKKELDIDEEARNKWYRHWVETGFKGIEAQLSGSPATGKFCHGDTPSMADACLVPQVFNANRLNCDLSAMPTIRRINEACLALDAFKQAGPAMQPDAE